MKMDIIKWTYLVIAAFAISSCTDSSELASFSGFEKQKDVSFDIVITRDGKVSSKADGGYDNIATQRDNEARLDPGKPFGLMGVDATTNRVIIDNTRQSPYCSVPTILMSVRPNSLPATGHT